MRFPMLSLQKSTMECGFVAIFHKKKNFSPNGLIFPEIGYIINEKKRDEGNPRSKPLRFQRTRAVG